MNLTVATQFEAELQINGLDSTEPGYEVDADIFTYMIGYRHSLMRNQNSHVYFGLGVGDAEYSFTETERVESTLNVGFVRIGADYNITENSYISGELRYQYLEHLDLKDTEAKIGNTLITGISIGYRF